jgi:hypothetical protein
MAYIVRRRRYYGPGLGLVGPDQPWTAENAGKVIQPITGDPCKPGVHDTRRMSEFATPKTERGGEVVENVDCFQTGKVWEARKPGLPRHVEWCCPKPVRLPRRALTQAEYEDWKDRCRPYRMPDGTMKETIPEWRDAETYVGSSCARTGIFDGGYELVCCPPPVPVSEMTVKGMEAGVLMPMTEEQQAELDVRIQQELLEREQERAAAALPTSFLARYWLPLVLVVGTVGVAVTAAMIKRRSVAKKKAAAVKPAAEAVTENAGLWEPRIVNGEDYDPMRPQLDLRQIEDDYWEAWWLDPGVGEDIFIGNIRDFGGRGYRFGAVSREGATGSHKSLGDAAAWLAKRTWRVV